jgi:hypothetical protein
LTINYNAFGTGYIFDSSVPSCTSSCTALPLLSSKNTWNTILCNTKCVKPAVIFCRNILPCFTPAEHKAATAVVALVTGPQAQLALVGGAHHLQGEAAGGLGDGLEIRIINLVCTLNILTFL